MFLDTREFPFTLALESRWQEIRQEFECLRPEQLMLWPEKEVYHGGWEVFGLWGAERRFEANCGLCPVTTVVLEQVPGLTTAGFSQLAPGTHIHPHEGYTDTVLRCHLGLVVPEGCGLEVGGQTRHWQEGECLIFDDTTRHSAWNALGHAANYFDVGFRAAREGVRPADFRRGRGRD